MKRLSVSALLFIAALLGFSSCVRHDDYVPQYQYIFSDEFDNDINHWSFTDNLNKAYVYLSNGQLHYDYHPLTTGTNTVAVATGLPYTQRAFDIQTRFQSDNAMAMVFGVSTSDYGYSFFIDGTGKFAVYDEGTSTISAAPLLNWTSSSAIRQGWNDVELLSTQDGYWTGYINGIQVFQIPAHSLYGSQVGFMVLNGTSGDADYLDVKW